MPTFIICPQCKLSFQSKRPGKRPQIFCSKNCKARMKHKTPSSRKGLKLGPHTPEHNRKIGLSKVGKKRKPFSKEWIANLTKTRQGERNGNWQGGITKEHLLIRMSKKSRLWKLAVFERDLHTCQGCGASGCELEAHHIKSFSEYPELRFEVSNGLTLCKSCHLKTDNYGRKKTNKQGTI